MAEENSSDISTDSMTQTIREAVNRALLQHKAVGNKVAFWHEGKIVVEVPSTIKPIDEKKHHCESG
ncbi:MAG: hypothetical protein DSY57_04185 [Desulfobulbus sp.]|nr:MAG: hypothetical protein DSY57_04185 [Desulfobulbus sp.]